MNTRTLLFFLGAVICFALPPSVWGQGVTSHRNAKGSCSVAATVVSATTKSPVADAWVDLSLRGGEGPKFPPPVLDYQVFTDAQGHFEIQDVPPTDYYLAIGKAGFVLWGTWGTGCHESAEVAVYHQPIQLMPAGVISGRVTNAKGQPLLGALVRVVSVLHGETQWRIKRATSAHFSTDDRGDYRIYGLHPGRYVVVVDYEPGIAYPYLPSQAPQRGRVFRERTYPRDVFYPGTTQISKAKEIILAPGQQISGINFQLVARRTYDIRGKISRLSITPRNVQPNLHMRVCGNRHVALPWPSGWNATLGPGGEFLVANVLPGCYELRARQMVPGGESRSASVRLEVRNHDIHGIHLKLEQSVDIPVRIVAEDLPGHRNIFISLQRGNGRSFLATKGSGNSESIRGVPPGSYRLYVKAYSLPRDAYVKSAHSGTRDALIYPVQILPGRRPGVLNVVIARNGAELTGTVTGRSSKPDARPTVVLVPAPPLRNAGCLYKTTSTGPTGRFVLQGIRPGSYTVFAWNGIREPDRPWFDPAFLKAMKGRGTPVKLVPGQHETLQLHAIPVPPSEDGTP